MAKRAGLIYNGPMEKKPAREIEELSALLRRCQHEYYLENRPTLSDEEYDGLFDRLLALEKAHPDLRRPDSPTMRVGSDLASNLPEVHHTIPVLSLDKTYSIDGVIAWMEKLTKQTDRELSFTVEEKIDGISIVLYYEGGILVRAVTRGNGLAGNDVTANVKTIPQVPLCLSRKVKVAVRGEIYLPLNRFDELNRRMEQPYANPRNLAAGTIRRIKSRDAAKIPLNIFVYEGFFDPPLDSHVEALDELKSLGFRLNPRNAQFTHMPKEEPSQGDLFAETPGLPGGFDALAHHIESSIRERAALPYEIDGLVIKVNQRDIREELGYTGHHPRWALAYKFEAPQGETTVTAIDIQVGRSGRAGDDYPGGPGGARLHRRFLYLQRDPAQPRLHKPPGIGGGGSGYPVETGRCDPRGGGGGGEKRGGESPLPPAGSLSRLRCQTHFEGGPSLLPRPGLSRPNPGAA